MAVSAKQTELLADRRRGRAGEIDRRTIVCVDGRRNAEGKRGRARQETEVRAEINPKNGRDPFSRAFASGRERGRERSHEDR